MWSLTNRTPFAADRNWTRDKDGAHIWVVAVKTTFDIAANGALRLSDEQPPPALAPEFHGDPASSSLRCESDLLAVKPETDIVLDAHAHAPGGRPAPAVHVMMRMNGLSKVLVVHGERHYSRGAFGVAMSAPRPFLTCPIRYEDAFGGSDLAPPDPARRRMDARNPVGKGVAADSDRLVDQPAHRIEYPSGNPASAGPAGFGPIASFWSPRTELLGTYDAAWAERKKPLLADDYDPRSALCSPLDQRVGGWLRGGELIELIHMTPDGLLRFELPRLYFTYSTRFGARRVEHRGHLATVHVAPEVRRVMLTYQTALTVPPRDVPYLDETVIGQKEYVR